MSGLTPGLAASSQKHTKSSNRSVKHRRSSGSWATSRAAWGLRVRGRGRRAEPCFRTTAPSPSFPPPVRTDKTKAPPSSVPQRGPEGYEGYAEVVPPLLPHTGYLPYCRPHTYPPTPQPAELSADCKDSLSRCPARPSLGQESRWVGVEEAGLPIGPSRLPAADSANRAPCLPPSTWRHEGSGALTQTVFTVLCRPAPLTRTRAVSSLPYWRVR